MSVIGKWIFEKLSLYFFILVGFNAYCQDLIVKDDSIDIASYSTIFSTTHKFAFIDFKHNKKSLVANNQIQSNQDNWLLFSFKNISSVNQFYVINSNFCDTLILYDFDTGKIVSASGNGFDYNFNKSIGNIPVGQLRFNLEADSSKNYLIKLSGSFPDEKVELTLNNATKIIEYEKLLYTQNLILCSIIATFLIFNLLVFIILRDKTYIFYLFYLLSLLFYLGSRIFVKWLDLRVNTYFFDSVYIDITLILYNFSVLWFTLSYFKIDKKSRWYTIVIGYHFLFLIPILIHIICYKNYYSELLSTSIALLSLSTIFIVLIYSLSNYSKKGISTILFLLAELPIIISGTYLITEYLFFEVEQTEMRGPTFFKIGIVLEILLFSFALGYRYREQKMLLINQIKENELMKTQRLEEIQRINERKNIELEQKVVERTIALEETNLKLEKLNHEKNKIFSIIGHDLKSPIASLQVMLELFSSGDLTQAEFELLSSSLKQKLNGVNNSIQNLFVWAYGQMDGETFHPIKFYIKQCIEQKIDLLKFAIDGKNIKIIDDNYSDFEVFADKDQIGIIIQNILNNAIKFTPINGTINIETIKNDRDFVELKIRDSGVGMTEESIIKILNNQTVDSREGTAGEIGSGFGLMICKEMLFKNNGKFLIDSKVGEGTNVTIVLPTQQT